MKCATQRSCRGWNKAVTSSVTGSGCVVVMNFRLFQPWQAKERFDTISLPPFGLGVMCSMENVVEEQRSGKRPYSHSPLASRITSVRMASETATDSGQLGFQARFSISSSRLMPSRRHIAAIMRTSSGGLVEDGGFFSEHA